MTALSRLTEWETVPTAVFLGMQERLDLPPLALYTIQGGPSDRSTVTAAKLVELGIAVPRMKAVNA